MTSFLQKEKAQKTQTAFSFFIGVNFINNLVEFFISDIITASIISAVFLMISNKKSESLDREDEKRLQEMKDHIDQKIDQAVLQIENELLELLKDRN